MSHRPPLFRRIPCWEAHTNRPINCWVGYDPLRPWEMSLTFDEPSGTHTWVMSRALLAHGLDRPVGVGSVRVWPRHTWRHKFVIVKLVAPEGESVVEFHRGDLGFAVDASYRMVPAGREADHDDWDAVIDRLLAGSR